MIIVNSDELIVFLNQHLKHKLNGNPASLTKYVLALLKKKRGEKELREILLDSLDVFLNKETPSFVDMLLSALKTKSYIREKENTDIATKDKELVKSSNEMDSGTENTFSKAKQDVPVKIEEKAASQEKIFPSSQGPMEPFGMIPPEMRQGRDQKIEMNVKKVFVNERCKDYELRGFCLAGNLCQYDHGSDALVVDDVGGVNELFPPRGPVAPPPPLPTQALPPLPPPPPEPPVYPIVLAGELVQPYNPEEPGMMGCMDYKASPYIDDTKYNMKPTRQRQLIGVPTVDNLVKKEREQAIKRKGNFDFNRLGPVCLKRKKFENESSSILELENVPLEINTIAYLNSLFSEFGNIRNIEIGLDGDSRTALIKFSNSLEAEHAFRNVDSKDFDVFYTSNGKRKKKEVDRGSVSSAPPHNFHENSAPDSNYAVKKNPSYRSVFIPKRSSLSTHNVFKKDFPKETKSTGGAMEKKLELLRKKHAFLATQIANYKLIADKIVTAKKQNKNETEFLKNSLQRVSTRIMGLKKEIQEESLLLKQFLSGGKKEKSAYNTNNEKAILDAELDFYNSSSLLRSKSTENPNSSERKETDKLLFEVNELKEKAKWLGLFEPPLHLKLDNTQVLEKQNSEEINTHASYTDSSLQEEHQNTEQSHDFSEPNAILLGDDEEEDDDEDSEARSWRR